jgi:hypothetical protein
MSYTKSFMAATSGLLLVAVTCFTADNAQADCWVQISCDKGPPNQWCRLGVFYLSNGTLKYGSQVSQLNQTFTTRPVDDKSKYRYCRRNSYGGKPDEFKEVECWNWALQDFAVTCSR